VKAEVWLWLQTTFNRKLSTI